MLLAGSPTHKTGLPDGLAKMLFDKLWSNFLFDFSLRDALGDVSLDGTFRSMSKTFWLATLMEVGMARKQESPCSWLLGMIERMRSSDIQSVSCRIDCNCRGVMYIISRCKLVVLERYVGPISFAGLIDEQ